MTLTKTLKKEWIKALRSGDYHQGRRFLCVTKDNKDYHCCLGVFLDISYVGYWRIIDLPSQPDQTVWSIGGFVGNLPYEYKSMFTDKQLQKLLSMNDVYEKSFNHIADWIETNL